MKRLSLLSRATGLFKHPHDFNGARKTTRIPETLRSLLKGKPWKSPRFIGGLSIFVILMGGLTYYLSTNTFAVAVMINGEEVGLAHNAGAAKNLVESILKEEGQPFGLVAKTHNQITYKTVTVKPTVYLESQLSKEALKDRLDPYLDGYELEADNSVIAVLPSEAAIQDVLNKYQDYYAKPTDKNKVTSVSFAETINHAETEVSPHQMKTPEQAFAMLLDGRITTTDYSVKANDSWWFIARKNDMLTAEVLAGNPGATEDTKLEPGDVIKLVKETPYLTVVSKGTYTDTVKVPYDTVTKTDNSLGSGQTKVVQNGKDGSEMVTYSYVKENGDDVSEDILEQKILEPAVNKVIAKGPSRQPVQVAQGISRGASQASGFVWPLQGIITSSFGSRPSRGDFHTGIDIAGRVGQTYYAAASGTVVAAGRDGGYGNMILIDHGNGLKTRYAHSSQLLVSVGQHVNQGQAIGLVGMTGNTTGPHLHFEVIRNGQPVNPKNYLP